jgi:hypothetical protein
MRTVSFSNKSVRRLLNQEFVNTYTNTTGDPTAGKSICHSPDDLPGHCERGVGGQNVQTIFMTPEGKIFHAANGYLSPEDLLAEIKFAKGLFAQIKGAEGGAERLVREAHRERLGELGFSKEEIADALSGDPFRRVDLIGNFEGGNIFAGKTKEAILTGNAFSIKHPMMDYQDFEADPTVLVGKGSTSFVSQRGGNGGSPEREIPWPDFDREND